MARSYIGKVSTHPTETETVGYENIGEPGDEPAKEVGHPNQGD